METTSTPTEEQVIAALKTVYDPEIPVNVYDLGLIYAIRITGNNRVEITMTLTNPNCPMAEEIPENVARAVKQLETVRDVRIELVFDPPWTKDNISDDAMLELGLL